VYVTAVKGHVATVKGHVTAAKYVKTCSQLHKTTKHVLQLQYDEARLFYTFMYRILTGVTSETI